METTRKKQPWRGSDARPGGPGSQSRAVLGCRQATELTFITGWPIFRNASASRSQSAGTANKNCLHGMASKLTRDSSYRNPRKGLGWVAYSNLLLFVPRRYLQNPFDDLKFCRLRPRFSTLTPADWRCLDGIILDAPLCFPISPLIRH